LSANTLEPPSQRILADPRTTKAARRALLYAVLILGGVGMVFPFAWMVLTSFKSYAEAIASPPTVFPAEWGQRLTVLGTMLRMVPWLIVLFALWMTLGWFIARRIPDPVVGGIYMFVHLGLFFVLGDLKIWGDWRLMALWQNAMARTGLELPSIWENYVEAWGRAPFGFYFRNSIVISVLTPLLIIVVSAPAAYAFARLRFPGQNLVFMMYLATMMVPSEVLLIPNFITITQLGWKNTYAALIVPWLANVVSIFFLRQFFKSIPNDLYDAATIDGAGHVRFLVSIAMPLARPALVSTGMFNFLSSWNSLLWPLLVTDKEEMRPIAQGLAAFSTEAGMQPQLYMAAATFSIVPILILFLFVQKQFIEGIARTGIR
jgi:ABC-type glycerol-3-phosphate transport system permease component